jgi:hypothetical protein
LGAAGYDLTTYLDAVKNEWVYPSIIAYVFNFCCLTKHRGSSIELCNLCLQRSEGDAVLQAVLKFELKHDSSFIIAVKFIIIVIVVVVVVIIIFIITSCSHTTEPTTTMYFN